MAHLLVLSQLERKISPCILFAGAYVQNPITLVENLELVVHLQQAKSRLAFVLLEVLSLCKKYVCPCNSFHKLIIRTVHDLLFGNLRKKLPQFEHFYQCCKLYPIYFYN